MKKTMIYVIRHAESAHNRSGSFSQEPGELYGKLGSPLSEEGKRQASHLASYFKDLPISCIYTSHLIRARKTAEILGEALSLPVHMRETLQERLDTESEQEAGESLFTTLQDSIISVGGKRSSVNRHQNPRRPEL